MRCSQCGSTDLVRGRYFHRSRLNRATLPCLCGNNREGLAACREVRQAILMQEWGTLNEVQEPYVEATETIGTEDEEALQTQVFCPTCVASARREDWRVAEIDLPEERIGQSPFIACHGCGNEDLIV